MTLLLTYKAKAVLFRAYGFPAGQWPEVHGFVKDQIYKSPAKHQGAHGQQT